MQKNARNIVALLLLLLLGAGVACAMVWYILVGHNWNVAASNIDDSIGQMDGYTVLLFEGTRDTVALEEAKLLEEARLAEQEGQTGKTDSLAQTEREGSAEQNNADGQAGSTEERNVGNQAEKAAQSGESEQDEETSQEAASDEEPITMAELKASYKEKGATVYTLDMMAKERYSHPLIMTKGDRRIGLFTIGNPARTAEALVSSKLLSRQDANFKIGITEDSSLKASELNDVQIIICDERNHDPEQSYIDGTAFWVDTPYVGQIEAIIISPSGVISSKTLGKAE